jgi:hypothetical protein
MHLNLLDTSPLSVFASSIRSKQIVYIRMQQYANVNASIKGDTKILFTNATPRLPCKHFVCVCNANEPFVESNKEGCNVHETFEDDNSNQLSSH